MRHFAIVVRGGRHYVRVRPEVHAGGCAGCALGEACGSAPHASDCSEGLRAAVDDGAVYAPGDRVVIESVRSTLGVAVALGVAVPVAILALAVWLVPGDGDGTLGAAVGLVGVALYFGALRLVGRALGRGTRWRVVGRATSSGVP